MTNLLFSIKGQMELAQALANLSGSKVTIGQRVDIIIGEIRSRIVIYRSMRNLNKSFKILKKDLMKEVDSYLPF